MFVSSNLITYKGGLLYGPMEPTRSSRKPFLLRETGIDFVHSRHRIRALFFLRLTEERTTYGYAHNLARTRFEHPAL